MLCRHAEVYVQPILVFATQVVVHNGADKDKASDKAHSDGAVVYPEGARVLALGLDGSGDGSVRPPRGSFNLDYVKNETVAMPFTLRIRLQVGLSRF